MSKEKIEITEPRKKLVTVERVKTAFICVFVATVLVQVGIVIGWTLRSQDQCRIESQASQLVEKLKSQK